MVGWICGCRTQEGGRLVVSVTSLQRKQRPNFVTLASEFPSPGVIFVAEGTWGQSDLWGHHQSVIY